MLKKFASLMILRVWLRWQANRRQPLRKTEFFMQLRADLDEPQNLGETPLGGRRIFYVKSGSFAGPRLRREVLLGGGD